MKSKTQTAAAAESEPTVHDKLREQHDLVSAETWDRVMGGLPREDIGNLMPGLAARRLRELQADDADEVREEAFAAAIAANSESIVQDEGVDNDDAGLAELLDETPTKPKPAVSDPTLTIVGAGAETEEPSDPPIVFCSNASTELGYARQRHETTWSGFVQWLRDLEPHQGELPLEEYLAADKRTQLREKRGARFYVLADVRGSTESGEQAHTAVRALRNLDAVYSAGFDVEGPGVTARGIAERLPGIKHVALTSYSHGPSEGRWRVIVPFSSPISPDQYPAVHAHLASKLDAESTGAAKDAARLWFPPGSPPDADELREFHVVDEGAVFDPASVPQAPRQERSTEGLAREDADDSDANRQALRVFAEQFVEDGRIPEGAQHPARKAIVAHAFARGLSAAAAIEEQEEHIPFENPGLGKAEEMADWYYGSPDKPKHNIPFGCLRVEEADFEVHLDEEEGTALRKQRAAERDAQLLELNRTCFFSMVEGQSFVCREQPKGPLTYMRTDAFTKWLLNKPVWRTEAGKKMAQTTLGEYWLRWSRRREYSDIVFAPGLHAPSGTYNTWRGWAVDPVPGDWSLFEAHIRKVICAGDEALAEWLLNWLAHMVQRPATAPGTALVLSGEQGTGKGKFFEWVGAMLPKEHRIATQDPRAVVGDHVAHLKDCLLLFLDECMFAGSARDADRMKGLITEPSLWIDPKFRPAENVPNRLHVVIASNHEHTVRLDPKDRRYVVFNISEAHRQDFPYFAAIDAQMQSGGVAAMLYDLLDRDISEFQVRCAPNTTGKVQQKQLSLEGPPAFLYEALWTGELPVGEHGGAATWDDAPATAGCDVQKRDVFAAYERWAGRKGRRSVDVSRFWRDVRAWVGGKEHKPRPELESERRVPCWIFPTLSAAREQFESQLGGSLEWAE